MVVHARQVSRLGALSEVGRLLLQVWLISAQIVFDLLADSRRPRLNLILRLGGSNVGHAQLVVGE